MSYFLKSDYVYYFFERLWISWTCRLRGPMGFTVKEQENFHTRLEEPAGLPLPLLSK